MSDSDDRTEQQGQPAAAGAVQLYEEVRPVLLRLLTGRFSLPEKDAAMLIEETYLAYQMLSEALPDVTQWLIMAACHNATTYLRRHGLSAAPPDPTTQARAAHDRLRQQAALETLSPQARKALRLHSEEGMTFAEIAAELGIPAFAVERMVTRARLKVWRAVREGET
jgi:RNA polymerase sigma factor (sigma-70 family)